MMAALHQHLRAAEREGLLDFLIHLIEGNDVGIVVFLRAIKGAELAIDIADVRVIDVAVDVVSNDFVAMAVVGGGLGEPAAAVGERAKLLQRQGVKAQGLGGVDPRAVPDFMQQPVQ